MEDSVGEEERREQGPQTMVKARQEEDERVEAGRGGGEPSEEGGFLSAVASKIGAAMTGGDETSDAINATSGASRGEEKEDGGHGGTGIFKKFKSSSHAPPDSGGAMETEEVKGEEKSQVDTGGEQGGILSSMASRIGMAMSGANGNANRDHQSAADSAKMTNGDAADHMNSEEKEEQKGEEANSGGILSTMASKIGAAMSSANGNGDNRSAADDAKMSNGDAADHENGEDKGKGGEANSGILSAIASKIGTAMSGANGEGDHGGSGENGKLSNGVAADGGSKAEAKGDEANGGGLVDQIRSSLPSADQAPEADEASLLIAIIED